MQKMLSQKLRPLAQPLYTGRMAQHILNEKKVNTTRRYAVGKRTKRGPQPSRLFLYTPYVTAPPLSLRYKLAWFCVPDWSVMHDGGRDVCVRPRIFTSGV